MTSSIFLATSSEEQKKEKVITTADARISMQNQVKSKKKVIMSADVQFFTQNHVKSKKRSSRPQKHEKKKRKLIKKMRK